MFLRRNRRKHGGELYEYWTLVESVRTARGPRQRVVATLGKLPSLDQEEQRGWEEVARLLDGREAGRRTLEMWMRSKGLRDLRPSGVLGCLYHRFHGRNPATQKPRPATPSRRRPTRQISCSTASSPRLGAAELPRNHSKYSGENLLKSSPKPLKCYIVPQ